MSWIKNPNVPAPDPDSDPNLKRVREIVYCFQDPRPTAPVPIIAEAFNIDEEAGDTFTSFPNSDVLILHQKRKDGPATVVTITVPHTNFLYREERRYVRKRHDHEPLPITLHVRE